MPKRLSIELAVLSLFCFPVLGWASSHPSVGISSLFWPALNSVTYLALLVYLYRRYGRDVVRQGSANIIARVDSAKQQLTIAQQALTETERRIESIEQEKQAIFREYEAEMERMVAAVKGQLQRDIATLQQNSERQITNEFANAESEFRRAVVRRAVELAQLKFLGEMSYDDDRRLRFQALDRL